MSVLCIVATPLAAVRAARRLCDAQGGLLFGPRVSTLERLVPGILAAAGDRRAVLTPLAERLLAIQAAQAAGAPLADAPPDGGLVAGLAACLSELRRAEVGAVDARAVAASLEGGAAARLHAVARALEAYEAALRALPVLDRAAAARAAAAAAARRGAALEPVELLVIDGVHAASPAEWDLLAALAARARRTRFHVPFMPERPDLCAPAEPFLRRVEALHELAATRQIEVVLPGLREGRAGRPAAFLEAFSGGAAPGPAEGGLLAAEPGAGEAGEPEAAARLLSRFLEAGLAPGDVAIVAPAPRRAAPGLARACAAAGIPFAAGRGPALAEAPPVRVVLDAIAAAAGGLDRSAAERLAESSYLAPAGLPGPLAPLLDRAGALDGRGAPQEALRARAARLSAPSATGEREALARAAGALDDLEASLRLLAAPGTGLEHAARVAAFLDAAGVRRRALRAPREVAARDVAALSALGDAADGLARALALTGRGAQRISAREHRALLALAVSEASLPPPPEPAAGAVELSGLDDAPGLAARAVVVTGCARGGWPPAAAPDPLLRDPERLALNRALRRAALATGASRHAEAIFRAFLAAAAGSEALGFAWAAPGPAGDGAALAPLVADALEAGGVPVPAAAPDPALPAARTARAALRAAARAGPPALRVLSRTPLAARAASAVARGRLERARREAVRARRPSPHAGAVGGAARAALQAALPAEWSPTQLEAYASCPFRAFLSSVARLDEPRADGLDVDVRDEGNLLHAVLERFVRGRVARGAWPPSGSPADLGEARAAAAEVFARFEREGRTGDPAVWAARRGAVLGRIERVVRAEARDHGGLTPVLLEHGFGGASGRPPLMVTAGGETVALRGRIDRVDAGPARLLVIDYKNSRSGRPGYADQLDPEAFGDTSFQIPTYLLEAVRALPGRPRAAATYALLGSAERLPALELAADDPALAREAGPAGRPPFAAAVVEAVRRMREGEFPIVSRSCDRCRFGAVCRFDGTALAEEDGRAA